ncbi:cysteine desulfurase NifS [Candidatus Magnetoovum chiemensis]|nr:cysteine desulfurase NifS [Candidatus Magnetoovum chiemensis]
MKITYLDNNATTQTFEDVIEGMMPYLSTYYGNPSSIYSFAGAVHVKMEEARQKVAELLGAKRKEIVFTSCGSESDNMAILSALSSNKDKKHIITTKVEHPAVYNFCKLLETEKGCSVTYLSVDRNGALDIDELRDAIREDTALVSVMYANNETGVMFPIKEIVQIVKARGVLFHTDAVQAAGKVSLNVEDLDVDMLSISGHKLHAPKGIGALYIREGIKAEPLIYGGHQEKGRRAGTENVASIIGLGIACEIAKNNMESENLYIKSLRDRLEETLLKECSDTIVNGADCPRLPNTSNISFGYIDGEAILLMLDKYRICVSTGSACSSGSDEPSRVLSSMNLPSAYIRGSIRFSLSRYNDNDDIDKVIEILPEIIKKLRAMSSFYKDAS